MADVRKIPATIVTGFLGSGKTTLVRNMLESAAGLRIAVIVNEFGELGIDGDILERCSLGCEEDVAGMETSGNVYELANGCLCCTVQEEFYPVMRQLLERSDRIDHVVIETSGLALPKPLVQAFNWPEIRNAFTVDAVVTVVDTPATAAGQFASNPQAVQQQRLADPNLDHQSALHELFEDQLLAADLVVLSKTDLVGEPQCRQVEEVVRQELPAQVKIIRSEQGKVSNSLLLGLGSASEETIDQRRGHHEHDEGHEHDHDHDQFDSMVVTLPVVDRSRLMEVLDRLVEEHTLFRIKGFVAIDGKPMRLVVQGVGRRFDSYYDRRWRDAETPHTQLVLIGQQLDEKLLQDALMTASVQGSEVSAVVSSGGHAGQAELI
ncbi:cobalamin biosynthesis protein CobW [Granulosicoccus sp. 3-233]|uniref:cobalamin biosynthesis protein CobW n=1 Tax=Granulosicoccus sp. 3-233 TaxID=3417969 RepID=UPI003D350A96